MLHGDESLVEACRSAILTKWVNWEAMGVVALDASGTIALILQQRWHVQAWSSPDNVASPCLGRRLKEPWRCSDGRAALVFRLFARQSAMQKQHEQCQRCTRRFIGEHAGLNHKGTAEQDGSNDESTIPENEAKIGQVAKRNHRKQTSTKISAVKSRCKRNHSGSCNAQSEPA